MIHPDDEQGLLRILRAGSVPPAIAAECDRWTRAYHSAGHNGPIGTLALISIVRLCGVELPEVVNKPTSTIWHSVKINTRVEGKFFGSWQPGTFLGLAQ